MKPLLYVSILFVAFGLASCSSDDFEGPEADPIVIADLAGTWTCTQFLATSENDPQMQFELISMGGSLAVTVQPDGAFVGEASFPDPDTGQLVVVPFGGTFDLTSQTLLVAGFLVEIPPFLESGTFEFTLIGNTLTLHQEVSTFDFDFDGVADPAVFDATLVRQ
ncbi:MAG: hypothetical protein HKP01_05115 [Gemmatimonadetes bacterium]|nr:hypothetical protein [Gemmatimonadota bacterium]